MCLLKRRFVLEGRFSDEVIYADTLTLCQKSLDEVMEKYKRVLDGNCPRLSVGRSK